MRTFVLVASLFVACVAQAQNTYRNIAYGPDLPAQSLDLYIPAKRPAQLVVFVHGGDWSGGGKAGGSRVAHELKDFAVASIDYRLLGEGSIQDEAADVARACAFLLAHADEYGIDPRHFALAGHSSGGHLVALVGTDPSYAKQAGWDFSRLAAVATLDGVFDLTLPFEMQRMRHKVNYDLHTWEILSPIKHLDSDQKLKNPNFCIVHEDKEPRFIEQADLFVAALHAHSRIVEEYTVPGLTHIELNARFDDPSVPVGSMTADCLKRFMKP